MTGESSAAFQPPAWVKREQERRDRDLSSPDGLGRLQPRRLFRGAVSLMALPGFAELWTGEVPRSALKDLGPDGYRRRLAVSCSCGHEPIELPFRQVHVCGGDCGRWFLQTEKAVLLCRWPREDAAAA